MEKIVEDEKKREGEREKKRKTEEKEKEYRFTTRDNEHDPCARCRNIALSDLPLCRSVLH